MENDAAVLAVRCSNSSFLITQWKNQSKREKEGKKGGKDRRYRRTREVSEGGEGGI